MDTVGHSDIASLKQDFLEELLKKGRCKKTVENYTRYLDRCIRYNSVHMLEDLNEKHISSFLTALGATHADFSLKNTTQNYYRIALRRFLTFLRSHGYEVPDPKTIALKKTDSKPCRFLSVDEIHLLQAPQIRKDVQYLRNRAICLSLLSLRVRVSVLCILNRDDVDLDTGVVNIPSLLQSKERFTLTEGARSSLEAYLAYRLDTEPALFLNNGKRNARDGSMRLTVRSVERILSKYAKEMGLHTRITPEILRISATNARCRGILA